MMIGRRAVVGLTLLVAVVVGVSAQSAWGAVAKNTTAFTCVKGEGERDFKDAHCNEKVAAGTGEYGHVAIKTGEQTKVTFTNAATAGGTKESTPAILKTILFGVKVEIACTKFTGEGTFANEEPEPKVHTGKGTGSGESTSCKVEKPSKCTVKEPLAINVEALPLEELGVGKNEMGGELKPAGGGTTFITIVLQGAECNVKGEYPITGSVVVTGTPAPTEKYTGATAVSTNAMSKETLKLGANAAELSLTTTARRAPIEGKEQNPIASTTTT
jgi:hypothetical protein